MADYAVVVGIARYPRLAADGATADLEGPDNDAQAVRDWLVDPDGGGLEPGNVRLLRSRDFDPMDPDDPQPAMQRVEREMEWIEQQTKTAAGGRLYLYFSGHGFAPRLEEGALFTADATQLRPQYVYVHAWLRWFRQAQRFRESVLWMDCCMNYQQSIPTNEVLIRAQVGTGVPGPAFIAVAAQTKSALESRMPDGQVHGVFTWALLKGLRGGAANERGQVTGESLRTFLHNVMPEYLPDEVRRAGSVDLRPFVRADPGLVIRRMDEPPTYPVRLTVPADAVGKPLRIWADRPYAEVVAETLAGTAWTGRLERGLYVAELPGLRQGFQVSGAGEVDVQVTQAGEPVAPPRGNERHRLHIKADNQAATITVIDYGFERIFTGTGELSVRDKPGVYKVRVEIGRDISLLSEEVILLDRDLHLDWATRRQLPSPAPVAGSAHTPSAHRDPFYDAARRTGAFAGLAADRSMISVSARFWAAPSTAAAAPRPHPMTGLRLLDEAGRMVADLSEHCTVEDRDPNDPMAVWERELDPGIYFLRHLLPGGRCFDGSVVACANWVTQVALQRTAPGSAGPSGGAPTDAIGDAAMFMRPPGGGTAGQDAVIEAARLALVQGRNLFDAGRGTELRDLLLQKFADPIAGIIGCHLLLRTMDAGRTDPALPTLYDDAVRHLRSLVGTGHPDVEALSLRCADARLRTGRAFTQPPMFSQGWRLLAAASYERRDLVPLELWSRVHAAGSLGPFLIWAADEATRAAHAELLTRWITDHAGGAQAELPDAARRAARGLSVPAAGLAALWEGRSTAE